MARIRPHLTKQSDAAVQALMAAFRTNSLTLEMALTLVATLVAVDTVSKELGRLIRLGKDDQQQARQG
jgi:hypothetical protein